MSGPASEVALTGSLSTSEARALTDRVKADAAALWAKLLSLYEGQAHIALGYRSWADYCAAEFDMGKSRSYQVLDAARVVEALPESTIVERPQSEAVARELTPVLRAAPDEVEDVWAEVVDLHGDSPTAAETRAVVQERRPPVRTSNSNEWYTPAEYVEAARMVLGGIDLDPASCTIANATVRATRFFTQSDDGLAQPWAGRVFMNPPYGGLVGKFVAKLADSYRHGQVTAAVVLVNAHSVDAAWFQKYLFDGELCFTNHRINFKSGVGNQKDSPTYGNAFAYFGPDPGAFASEFARFGAIVRRWRP